MKTSIERLEKRDKSCVVPEPLPGEPGLFQINASWGTIPRIHVAEGVRSVSEKEVIAHLEQGLLVVDRRTRDFYVASTVPGPRNIPYPEVVEHIDELDQEQPIIFFCNGLQCGRSRTAIHALLEAGFPAGKILHYRGGLHDWLTLGLPVVAGE